MPKQTKLEALCQKQNRSCKKCWQSVPPPKKCRKGCSIGDMKNEDCYCKLPCVLLSNQLREEKKVSTEPWSVIKNQ